jgi:hypothetical protein
MATEKERLKAALFSVDGREIVDVKLFPGSARDITEDQVCLEMNRSMAQVRSGERTPVRFLDRGKLEKRSFA